MTAKRGTPKSIDEYIAGFPNDVQEILQKVRMTIKKAAPDAGEKISYRIPTFTLNGTYLVYFAAHTNHVGLYPIPKGTAKFREEIAPYKAGKGTLRFPLDKRIPYGLITRIVKFSIEDNLKRTQKKKKRSG